MNRTGRRSWQPGARLITTAAAAIALLLALWLGSSAAEAREAASVDKIILVTIDALRADRLGCYGYRQRPTSPAIDTFAAGALLFERAYAQAPWSVPSMGSLLSGYYARNAGAYTNRGDIVVTTPTLPERLRAHGYRTAFFNSNPVLWRPGIMRGFDSVAPVPLGEKIPYTSIEPLVMKWLDLHAREKFFLWIHDMDTHKPPTPGNTYLDKPDWDHYDSEVRWVDEAMERLFAKLDALVIRQDVLFIFTADHGEAFNEHGLYGHQDVIYDEVLRVPLIIQYPGMARKGRFSEPVQLLDMNPTIAQLAGLEQAPRHAGESLVPITDGSAEHVKHPYIVSSRYYLDRDRVDPAGKVLVGRGEHHLAIRDSKWVLIAKVRGTSNDPKERPDWDRVNQPAKYELYDLDADPLQLHDVFSDQPAAAATMQQALDSWKRATEQGVSDAEVETKPGAREAMRILGYESH